MPKTIGLGLTGAAAGISAVNVLYTVLFAVVSIAVVLAAVCLLTKFMGRKKETAAFSVKRDSSAQDGATGAEEGQSAANTAPKLNFTALLWAVLAIGFVLRLIFTFLSIGYRPEYNRITGLMEYVDKNGFSGYYGGSDALFPFTAYIYALMGAFASLFQLNAASAAMPLFVKLPLIVSDLLAAVIVYKAAKRYINDYVALVAAAFVCVFPVFVFASSVWGSLYSLLTLFLVAVLYFVVQKNFAAATGLYGASLLIAKEAIFLFPLMAVYLIYNFIKAIKTVKRKRPENFSALLHDGECAPAFGIPVNIVAATALMYLLSLPAVAGSYGAGFFDWIYRLFLYPLVDLSAFGTNSLSIFNLFMRNGKDPGSQFPAVVFVVIFAVIITAIILLIYLSKKNRANLVYLGAYILFTLATYFIDFSELSLLPVLGLFLLSFIYIRDKRIWKILGLLGTVVVLNASLVMSGAGFLNNLDASAIAGLHGNLILSGSAGIAGSVILSVLAVLTHLYATLVLLDISMSNKRKPFAYSANVKPGEAIVSWIKR